MDVRCWRFMGRFIGSYIIGNDVYVVGIVYFYYLFILMSMFVGMFIRCLFSVNGCYR